MTTKTARLPLTGIKVLELAGLAPAPFAGMILSDFGAQVTRVSKPGDVSKLDSFSRGKRSICVDLKFGKDVFKRLNANTDILIEPYRAGVMEKLGLGPEILCKENKKLIYVRLNGYGNKGCLSLRAGHDINFLAISGILSRLGMKDHNPSPPINLLGDFGGGSFAAVIGIMMALFERSVSGEGQVVESSITEGTAYLSSFLYRTKGLEYWAGGRGNNFLDGGAPFYQTYETKDGKYMAVGAIEPQFYGLFIEKLGNDSICLKNQFDIPLWPSMRESISEIFKSKTQVEWINIYKGTDACVTPVLDMEEAPLYSHNVDNKTFMKNSSGDQEPCPAPKLSRTPGICEVRQNPMPGEHSLEILHEEGFSNEEIESMMADRIIEQYIPESSL